MPPPDPMARPTLSPVAQSEQSRALALLFRDVTTPERLQRVALTLADSTRNRHLLRDLLAAHRGGDLVAAVWGQSLPGRTAVVWGPELVDGEPANTADSLLEMLLPRLTARQTRVVQAMPNSPRTANRLADHGFRSAVELAYLAAPVDKDQPGPQSEKLAFLPYEHAWRGRLAAIIEGTYRNTQDVPQLNGVRDLDDIIEGYMQTGVFQPHLWWVLRADEQDVGCLLLTDHPDRDQFELVYMGLIPEARGRGWGREIVEFGKWQAACGRRRHLTLAVDAANDPALRIYAAAGFHTVLRRTVYLRIL